MPVIFYDEEVECLPEVNELTEEFYSDNDQMVICSNITITVMLGSQDTLR